MSIDILINQIFLYPRPFVLTGAGVSTESGIPDFRGSGGLWEKIDPMETFSAWAFKHYPERLYRHSKDIFGFILKAEPNAAHKVLGEWQQKRIIGPVVTQNIDDLHQKGGAFWVYEVHGHVRTATCSKCHKTVQDMQEIIRQQEKGLLVPRCSECGGVLKPDVILFGDAMPADYMYAVNMADLFNDFPQMVIVVGSSLAVSPINSFPLAFEQFGIINNSPTMLDDQANIIMTGMAGQILSGINKKLVELNGDREIKVLPAGFIPGRLVSMIDDFYRSILAEQKSRFKPSARWNILKKDIKLLKKLFAFYKEQGRQQELEYYIVHFLEEKLNQIEQALYKEVFKLNIALKREQESYLINSVTKLLYIYNQAVCRYITQYNADKKVLEEMILQYIGIFGLYKKLLELDNLSEEAGLSSELDKMVKLAAAKGILLHINKALTDF